mmetsp:Transcript_46670/g.108431  ORF Transcript_46670/g.108431 Transcript_46670/m.108431 type:complete len:159 (-) Transcript_46670:265-741(-)
MDLPDASRIAAFDHDECPQRLGHTMGQSAYDDDKRRHMLNRRLAPSFAAASAARSAPRRHCPASPTPRGQHLPCSLLMLLLPSAFLAFFLVRSEHVYIRIPAFVVQAAHMLSMYIRNGAQKKHMLLSTNNIEMRIARADHWPQVLVTCRACCCTADAI